MSTSDKLAALSKATTKASNHKPRTTPKPQPKAEAKDGKRITSYLHNEEVGAVQRIQALLLKAGYSAPTFSAVLGAAIMEFSQGSDADILKAIQARPDGRK
jgi:hypothetical protein